MHQLVEPSLIFIIHKTVIVDPENLMDKQADHSAFVLHRLLLQQQAAMDNTREVSQVEDVVRLSRSWKQVHHGFLVHL